MTESDFWSHLEFLLCREFAGLPDNHLRFLWCDGFIPEQYILNDRSPRITGLAWIGDRPAQQQWSFSLFLNRPYGSRSEIEWQSQLPPENMTLWFAVDPQGRRLQIEPSAAVVDPAAPDAVPEG
jgi:hypothetical protein